MAQPPDRPPDAPPPACPCGHDNVPAEVAGQHPLLERAADGDREAFAQLYDTQVDGIYRYLLAWTGDPAAAAALTGEVFHGAFSWLAVTHITDAEAGAWLTAMARDAVAQRRGPGATPAAADPVAAVAQLPDPKREVVVLRLLCGHSLDHTAHLSGFTRRAVLELQLAACLSIWELTSGATAPAPQQAAAEEFEHHLTRWDLDPPTSAGTPAGPPAPSTGALEVARSLRQAAPGYVVGPEPALVERLRHGLLAGKPTTDLGEGRTDLRAPEALQARGSPASRSRGPRIGRVAGLETWWRRVSTGLVDARLLRRPWLATGVATAGIVAVLTLQAFGDPAPPRACGGRPCPPTTTIAAVAAAGSGSLGTPRTTVLQPSTTTSTLATPVPPPSAPRT
ncbi:MAG TPA: hypothetical protein VH479_10110, partial [Acidimicrobiales bacterium]